MKIVIVDNLARETVAERLFAINDVAMTDLPGDQASALCDWLNDARWENDERWYTVQEDDYRLWRGMEELV